MLQPKNDLQGFQSSNNDGCQKEEQMIKEIDEENESKHSFDH